ncbi:MAG TPA: ROK family protein [Thermomicrobiales bacterium]|nr:ROK family protein [Thermomicrobiales bacterium]
MSAASNGNIVLGIDIGGSGIKGALVDVEAGELVERRFRIPTPQPSKPKKVAAVVKQIVDHFEWNGPVGATFPAIVRGGRVYSAANVHKSWIGTDGRALFEAQTGLPFELVNDADAAGIAEMTYGAGKGRTGTVLMLTLGTGIGSALFRDGVLVPNTELGHLIFKGSDAEHYAADSVREAEKLSWKAWGKRVAAYLDHVEYLFSPNLIIIGGGVSKKHEHYFRYFHTEAQVVPAKMLNEAGIIGAALEAHRSMQRA